MLASIAARDYQQAMDTEPKKPQAESEKPAPKPQEFGGSAKPEPTRYGDWEIGGKCVDF